MIDATTSSQPHRAMWLIWLLLFAGLPALVARWEARAPAADAARVALVQRARLKRAPTAAPVVQPVELYTLDRDQAQTFNAAVPFSHLPNPAARPFMFNGSESDLARAIDCLAAAQLYEAGDDAVGERAVAQVVLNRVRHPAFPKTVCGVVFQGQERSTGCQFTFTCDGALARTPGPAAWERAREIAKAALAGKVFKPVGYATHYHTDWVVPYWSGSLDKIAAVGTHLFFRWRGWWGTPPAFRLARASVEPVIARIARLSMAHRDGNVFVSGMPVTASGGLEALTAKPPEAIGADSVGRVMGGVRLIDIAPGARAFLVELGKGTAADSWPVIVQTFCAGRPECRIMAWRSGIAPAGFPLSEDHLENMSFAYIHNQATGLQRALWNCAQAPRENKGECMRQRLPVEQAKAPPPLEGVRRRERFEAVTIAPPGKVVNEMAN